MSNWTFIHGNLINMDLVQFIKKKGDDKISLVFREDDEFMDYHLIYFSTVSNRDMMFEKIRQFVGAPIL